MNATRQESPAVHRGPRAFPREYVVEGLLPLTAGSLLRIDGGRDLVVYVWEGDAWITQDGDAEDHMLGAGDWFRVDSTGTVIVSALARTAVSITGPEPAFYASRIQHYRAGSSEPRTLYDARRAGIGGSREFGAWLRRRWAGLFADHATPTTASL